MKKKQGSEISVEEVVSILIDHKDYFGLCFSPDEIFKKWVINLPDILLQMNIDALDYDAMTANIPKSELNQMVKFSEIFSSGNKVELAQFLENITPHLLSILRQNVVPALTVAGQWHEMIEVHDLLVGYNSFLKEGMLNPLKFERWLNREDNQHFRQLIDKLALVMGNYLFQSETAIQQLYLTSIQSDTEVWIDFLIESPDLISPLRLALLDAEVVMKKWDEEQIQRSIAESADASQTIQSQAFDRKGVVDLIRKTHSYSESMLYNLKNLRKLYPKSDNIAVDFDKFVRLFYFKDMPESKLQAIKVIYKFLETSKNMNDDEFLLKAQKLIQADNTGHLHDLIADVSQGTQHFSALMKQLSSGIGKQTFFPAANTLRSEIEDELAKVEERHPQIFSGIESKAFMRKDSGKYLYSDTNAIFSIPGQLAAEMIIDKSLSIFKFQLIFAFRGVLRQNNQFEEYLADTNLYDFVNTNMPNSLNDLNDYIKINEAYTALSEEFSQRLKELRLLKSLFEKREFKKLFSTHFIRILNDQLSKLPDTVEINHDAHNSIDNIVKIMRIYHYVLPAIHFVNYSVASEVMAMIAVVKHEYEKNVVIYNGKPDTDHIPDERLIQTYLRDEIGQDINSLHDLLRVHQLHKLLLNSVAITNLRGNQSEIRRQSMIIQRLNDEKEKQSSRSVQYNTDVGVKDIEQERHLKTHEEIILAALAKAINSVGQKDYDPVLYGEGIDNIDAYLNQLMVENNEEKIAAFQSKLDAIYSQEPVHETYFSPLAWTETAHPESDIKYQNSSEVADPGNEAFGENDTSISDSDSKPRK